jgi:flagellar biosynthesis protein FlhA
MNPWMQRLDGLLGANAGLIRNLAPPIFIVIVLAMMVLPIPALLLDCSSPSTSRGADGDDGGGLHGAPLDFAAFPSVLLLTTLMRLSLNVASTRVVLLEGHTGPAPPAR